LLVYYILYTNFCITRRNCIAPIFVSAVFITPSKRYFVNTYRSRATNMATTRNFEASRTPFLATPVTKKNRNNYFLSSSRRCIECNYHEDARKIFCCAILRRYKFLDYVIDNVSYLLGQKMAALIGSGRCT